MRGLVVFLFLSSSASAQGGEVHFKRLERMLKSQRPRQASLKRRTVVARTEFDRQGDDWLVQTLGVTPMSRSLR